MINRFPLRILRRVRHRFARHRLDASIEDRVDLISGELVLLSEESAIVPKSLSKVETCLCVL